LDDVREFEAHSQAVDEGELQELADFWVTLIKNTGNKIKKKNEEFDNLWFTRCKHCLAHFALDAPFLMLLYANWILPAPLSSLLFGRNNGC